MSEKARVAALIVKRQAWDKFDDAPLTDLSPERLRAARAEQETGYLIDTDRLFSTMYHEWDALQKDVNTMSGAIQTLTFRAVPAVREGEQPSERAKELADVVNTAIWKGSQQPTGEWEHSFADLLGCLYHALCRGVNVHEIKWKQAGGIIYPCAYVPLSPQYYRWETRPGRPDRLLLYKDGIFRTNDEGKPFPANRFIVALNTTGPDHPMRNALFLPLVGWFGAAHWGLRWLMDYCQVYGIPLKVFNIADPEDRKAMKESIETGNIMTDFVLNNGDTVDIKTPSGGTSIPQAELVTMAERACHKLILGQTLTSDTSESGSRAQAEVHNQVQAAEVLAAGNYVAGVLTSQLVPAIVRMNFGSAEGEPLPEIRCSLPGNKATMENAQLYDVIINKLRMPVQKSHLYDVFGLEMPKEGEDVIGPAEMPAPGLDSISAAAAAIAAAYPKAPAPHEDAVMRGDRAEARAMALFEPWARPVLDAIKASRTPQELLGKLDGLRLNTAILADGLAETTLDGLDLTDETEIAAACNGSGHGFGTTPCPQGLGNSSTPNNTQQSAQQTTPPQKSITQQAARNTPDGQAIFSAAVNARNTPQGVRHSTVDYHLSPVSATLKQKALAAFNSANNTDHPKYTLNLEGYDHTISEDSLSHAINGHAYLKDDDFLLIPDMQDNPDSVVFEWRNNEPRLMLSKEYDAGKYVLIERVSTRHRNSTHLNNLRFVTFYME